MDASAHRPRLRPDPRLRPARRGLARPEPGPHHQGRRLHGPGRQGRRHRDRQQRQDRARHPRHRPRPAVRRRGREPQLHLRHLPPVLRRHDGPQHGHEPRPGLRPRRLHGGAPPLALHLQRDDQDAQRRADRPPLHDAGLLLLPPRRLDGLRLAGQPVLRHRRQHGQQPELDQRRLHQRAPAVHAPVPGRHRPDHLRGHRLRRRHDRPGRGRRRCRHEHHAQPAGVGSLAACGYISYGDARQTSGNTNAFEGKLLRIRPLANPPANNPGVGTSYTIPGPDAAERRRTCSRRPARP